MRHVDLSCRRSVSEANRGGRMEAVRPRTAASGPRLRRALIVTAGLTVLADLALWAVAPGTFRTLPMAYWIMAVLAVVADARPHPLPGRRVSRVVLPSTCFTFAIVLAWGFVPALAVQLVAVTVAGVRMRHAVPRTIHLALQHA